MNDQDWSDYKRWRAIYGEPEIYIWQDREGLCMFPNDARYKCVIPAGMRIDESGWHSEGEQLIPTERIFYTARKHTEIPESVTDFMDKLHDECEKYDLSYTCMVSDTPLHEKDHDIILGQVTFVSIRANRKVLKILLQKIWTRMVNGLKLDRGESNER